ncbi:MAG: menaquinone biosynthesis protein [Desulfobacter sp.]|nr:MAG: menaquinone biosynthesis protein [Desulfobacter sp.]
MKSNVLMGKISYINASPVYYGLDHGMLPKWLKLVPDVPTALNASIKKGEIDISPISAAFYAMNHEDLLVLPDLSISCNGDVLSVICASNYPLDELSGKQVMFSNESATSSSLLKMIFSRRGITPRFRVGSVTAIDQVPADVDAIMVIGDTALTQPWERRFKNRFDLGRVWHEMTGLPFVFALWVVRKSFAEKYPDMTAAAHNLLLSSMAMGYKNLDTVIRAGQKKLCLSSDLIKLYYELLICDLDRSKVRAMGVFFDSLHDQGILARKAEIKFFTP